MNPQDLYEGIGDSASDDSDGGECTGRYVPAIASPLGEQDFEYYWGEELLTLYHQLQDTCAAQGWTLLEQLDFCDFCKFAFAKSSRVKPTC